MQTVFFFMSALLLLLLLWYYYYPIDIFGGLNVAIDAVFLVLFQLCAGEEMPFSANVWHVLVCTAFVVLVSTISSFIKFYFEAEHLLRLSSLLMKWGWICRAVYYCIAVTRLVHVRVWG